MTEVKKDEFEAAFEEVALAAEKDAGKTADQLAAEAKAAEGAAAAAAKAAESKTPEQIAAEAKAAEDAAVAAKAAEDAAAAAAKANEGKTPEQIAAEAKAAEDAKAAQDAAAAAEKAKADAAAAEKARADAAAAEAAAKVETPEEKAQREALEASIKPYEPTAEEKAALAAFEKDFPNEFAAMQARLKGVDKDINARVYAAVQGVLKHVAPRLDAVEATTVESAAERHFSALKAAHADYDAVIPKVAAWIKAQPAYLQPAMQAVYDSGTTQDVMALVSDYKKAAGVTVTDPAADAAAKAAAAKKGKPADADDLTPVGTRRTAVGPKGAPDKNDYDGAWAELVSATGGK